jgi:hypothetical protein
MRSVGEVLEEKAVMVCFGTVSYHSSSMTQEDTGKSPDIAVVEIQTALF